MSHRGGRGKKETDIAAKEKEKELQQLKQKLRTAENAVKTQKEESERLRQRLASTRDELKAAKEYQLDDGSGGGDGGAGGKSLRRRRGGRGKGSDDDESPSDTSSKRGGGLSLFPGVGGGVGGGGGAGGKLSMLGDVDDTILEVFEVLMEVNERIKGGGGGADNFVMAGYPTALNTEHLTSKFGSIEGVTGGDADGGAAKHTIETVEVACGVDVCHFKVTNNLTFGALLEDASRYWDFLAEDACLQDASKVTWPLDALVVEELANVEGIPKVFVSVRAGGGGGAALGGGGGGHASSVAGSGVSKEDVNASLDGGGVVMEQMQRETGGVRMETYVARGSEEELALREERERLLRKRMAERKEFAEVHKDIRTRIGSITEVLVFLLFLALVCGVFIKRRDAQNSFYLYESMRIGFAEEEVVGAEHRKVLTDVHTVEDFWEYMEGTFMNVYYPSQFYSGLTMVAKQQEYVLGYNKKIGGVRVRQLRVKQKTCKTHGSTAESELNNNFRCYPRYSSSDASEESYGPELKFAYASDAVTDAPSISGKLSTYDGGGFFVDWPDTTRSTAEKSLAELRNDLWLDLQTRAVVVSFPTFNVNYKLLSVNYVLFEFSPGGNVFATFKSTPIPLEMWSGNAQDMFVMEVFVILSFACILVFHMSRARLARKDDGIPVRKYFMEFWNAMDVVTTAFYLATLILEGFYATSSKLSDFELDPVAYIEYAELGLRYDRIFYMLGITSCLVFFRMFKYLNISRRIHLLWSSIRRAIPEFLAYSVLFACTLFGFAFFGHVVFGANLAKFATFGDAIWTLLDILAGNANYQELKDVHLIMGPFFMVMYILVVVLTLASMFMAIMVHSYSVTSEYGRFGYTLQEDWRVTLRRWRQLLNPFGEKKKQFKTMRKDDAENREDAMNTVLSFVNTA